MTATRLVGIPIVLYPLLRGWFAGRGRTFGERLRRSIPALFVALAATLGTAAFFTFLHCQFGRWNLYFAIEKIGWKVTADYLCLFRPETYAFSLDLTKPEHCSKMAMLLTLAHLLSW